MCMYICIVKAGVGRLGEAVTARDKPKKSRIFIRLFAVRRLLALETVVVVWQFAFAFAAVWQAHFQEVVADHEGEVAGVII